MLLHFTKYHPDYRMMNNPETPIVTLEKARKIAMQAGLKYVYTGNVLDFEGQATYCPNCGESVIQRQYYEIKGWALKNACCAHCQTPIDGFFEEQPGHRGNQRQPIRLG